MKSIGRLTVVRQTFPMPQNATQRCVKHNHRINTSLCDLKNARAQQLEVSGIWFVDLSVRQLNDMKYLHDDPVKKLICHSPRVGIICLSKLLFIFLLF